MKRTSHAVDSRPGPATPAGDMAQPDERDLTPEQHVDRQDMGPRLIVEQAARDIAHGLEDTDLHGTPSNVPGPVSGEIGSSPATPAGGDRRSYAPDQIKPGADRPDSATSPRTTPGKPPGNVR